MTYGLRAGRLRACPKPAVPRLRYRTTRCFVAFAATGC